MSGDLILRNRRMLSLAVSVVGIFLALTTLLADRQPVLAGPLPTVRVRAIPAFARKYGMPCSSCHLAWPMLSPFGQMFKDNGYQLGNDRDAPIYQNPAYWPVTFRMTTFWHRESTNHVQVDDPTAPGGQNEAKITTHGFDWSGLDFHTGGTLAKNVSFYVLPSSDNTGAFHFETVFARLDNVGGSSWLNFKLGKFELDNLLSEKRILTLTNEAGVYQNYHFQPATESGFYTFGIGDNQVGAEWMGHSKDDRTRVSASLLSSTDGSPGLPEGSAYDTFLTASQAFQIGALGLQRVGGFAYIGQSPTYFKYSEAGVPIAGTGAGNKGFYRAGFIGQFYVKKFDFTPMYFRGHDSAFLGTGTAADGVAVLPVGAHAPSWNGALIETHYTYSPQLILINRYEAVRMTQQALPIDPTNIYLPGVSVPSSKFGNLDLLAFGFRYYPFISSRAGFAYHAEYSVLRQRDQAPITGRDLTTSSLLLGFDFAF
jgi:hypothetical protein